MEQDETEPEEVMLIMLTVLINRVLDSGCYNICDDTNNNPDERSGTRSKNIVPEGTC